MTAVLHGAGRLVMPEILEGDVPNPSDGDIAIFVDANDKIVKTKSSGGVVTAPSGGGGGGTLSMSDLTDVANSVLPTSGQFLKGDGNLFQITQIGTADILGLGALAQKNTVTEDDINAGAVTTSKLADAFTGNPASFEAATITVDIKGRVTSATANTIGSIASQESNNVQISGGNIEGVYMGTQDVIPKIVVTDLDIDGFAELGTVRLEDDSGALSIRNIGNTDYLDFFAKEITLTNDINAVNGVFSGDIDAVELTLTDDVNAVNGIFSGNIEGVELTLSNDVNALNGVFSSDLTSIRGNFSGNITITSPSGNFNLIEWDVPNTDVSFRMRGHYDSGSGVTNFRMGSTNASNQTRNFLGYDADADLLELFRDTQHSGDNLGFYNSTPASQQTVGGDLTDGTALENLLDALDLIGIIDKGSVT